MADEQAAHLPRVVGQAGQTAPGDHARARGRRRRRALDNHVQPGAVHSRPARRALPGGRFRRVRVRPGRLDHDGCVPSRPGVAARQRGVRGRAVRRCARHPAHVHPPRERFEAAERPARTDLSPLRPGHRPGEGSRDQPEAPQGDRDRGSPRTGRGAVVAALAHHAERGRTVSGEPAAHLADRDGGLNVTGRSWQEDGTLSARYWSEAGKERRDPAGRFYFWKGERPRNPDAPQLEGTGEIRVETTDRATGYWTTRSDRDPGLNARTAGVYLRADPSDLQ